MKDYIVDFEMNDGTRTFVHHSQTYRIDIIEMIESSFFVRINNQGLYANASNIAYFEINEVEEDETNE